MPTYEPRRIFPIAFDVGPVFYGVTFFENTEGMALLGVGLCVRSWRISAHIDLLYHYYSTASD